jgi:thiamine-monophosphate kinase
MKDEDEQTPKEHSAESSAKVSSSRSEFDFINTLRRRADSSSTPQLASLVSGIGDDAAVVRTTPGKDTVITTDLLVEDIDFRRESISAQFLGHKALAVSLSDIAALGARARWALLSVGVPEDVWKTEFLDRLYDGLFELALRYDVKLVGGDTSRTTEKIVIDSIVIGESTSGLSVTRSGAQPGDQIFVTGSLGGAAAGLRLIERGAHLHDQLATSADTQSLEQLLVRHLRPEPRVGWGLVLGQERLVTAMIDLSDGLSSDLNHLCAQSSVGALVESSQIPIDVCVAELCGRRALDPLLLALHGGEDFELLFTVRPRDVARLPRRVDGVSITRIGEIKGSSEGVRISEGAHVWQLDPGGWEHFRKE